MVEVTGCARWEGFALEVGGVGWGCGDEGVDERGRWGLRAFPEIAGRG